MEKLKHNISIWLLSFLGFIMFGHLTFSIIKEPDILTSMTNDPVGPVPLILSIFHTAYHMCSILIILIVIALIELGLKHYKHIGYEFNHPIINNPFVLFLFKLGFYFMFFPMMLVLTFMCVTICVIVRKFINEFIFVLAWTIPTLTTTILIFWDVPIKIKYAKYGIVFIFLLYIVFVLILCILQKLIYNAYLWVNQ